MRIAIVFRPVPALKGREAGFADGFRQAGHDVVADREEFDPSVDAVLIPNMPTGYPPRPEAAQLRQGGGIAGRHVRDQHRVLAQLRSLGPRRPRVVVWMTEPLLPPLASGVP